MSPDWEISPQATQAKLQQTEAPLLIDCREADEYAFCRISGAQLVPLSQFTTLAPELDIPAEGVIVYCHHGVRSLQATAYLRQLGHENTVSMAGGIDLWSLEIDSSLPRY